MSEVQNRQSAPRGRSSASSRGGRAAFGSRGGRGGRGQAANGDKPENDSPLPIEDSPELIELKKQYGTKISTISELFPDWADEDIIYALQETNGDLELTVDKIADGTLTPFGSVDTKKDRSRSKAAAKDTTTTSTLGESTNASRGVRGGRGTQDGGRGGRGRGSERGARAGGRGRGAAIAQSNGSARPKEISEPISIPTEDVWESVKQEDSSNDRESAKPAEEGWGTTVAETVTAGATTVSETVTAAASSLIPEGAKKSWASMFKVAPVPEKKKPVAPAPVEKASEPEPVVEEPVVEEAPAEIATEELPHVPAEDPVEEEQVTPTPDVPEPESTSTTITPSKDELTETNLEQVPDVSAPVSTETAASTAASSWAPRNDALSSAIRPPPTSGFAASAQKATATPARLPSFQRRTLDQEEAVRMPGNREVDRAAVQFGTFNLGSEEDVDGDREEPETRAQPPQHSPVAHPRASLPPAPAQQQSGLPASLPSPKEATGLPSAPTAAPGLPSPQTQSGSQSMTQQGSQSQYGQYGRYGQSTQEQSGFGQKPYDPFSQQAPGAQSQYEGYQGQSHAQAQPSAFSSAPNDYSSAYYTTDQRNAYSQYYGHGYGQQGSQSQEAPAPQRSVSGFNAGSSENPSAYGAQSSSTPAQSRYATAAVEGNNSGHNTPNPAAQGQQAAGQGQSQSHLGQQHNPGGYPYGHPYYSSPYYSAYVNQYQGYGQGGYNGPYGGKGGMYGQSHGYGMPPQAPYDHTASPAAGGFGQSSTGRDSAVGGSGLEGYGRTGSQQSSQALGGSSAFGAMGDTFGRNSSYQGQGQHYSQQGNQPAAADDLKPFGEGKSGNGPSPLLSQAARPGSAANSGPGNSALPPPQSSQYSGYPSHLQHGGLHGSQTGSQYGGLGGAGGYGQAGSGHQSSPYGGYGQGFGGNSYANQQRGGWGNNYGGQGH